MEQNNKRKAESSTASIRKKKRQGKQSKRRSYDRFVNRRNHQVVESYYQAIYDKYSLGETFDPDQTIVRHAHSALDSTQRHVELPEIDMSDGISVDDFLALMSFSSPMMEVPTYSTSFRPPGDDYPRTTSSKCSDPGIEVHVLHGGSELLISDSATEIVHSRPCVEETPVSPNTSRRQVDNVSECSFGLFRPSDFEGTAFEWRDPLPATRQQVDTDYSSATLSGACEQSSSVSERLSVTSTGTVQPPSGICFHYGVKTVTTSFLTQRLSRYHFLVKWLKTLNGRRCTISFGNVVYKVENYEFGRKLGYLVLRRVS